MTETSGHLNKIPLLNDCREAIWNIKGPITARTQAIAVITVLRRRGLLNDLGVEIVRAEMGDRK